MLADWQFTPYAIPLFIGSVILLGVVIISVQKRTARGARYLALTSGTTLFYTLGYAFELGSPTLPAVQFWLKVEYIGVTLAPVFIFLVITVYAGQQRLHTPLNVALLLVIPAITLIFAWTNGRHELIWQDMALNDTEPPFLVEFTRGPWYWVHIVFIWGCLGAGVWLLIGQWRKVVGLYRKQVNIFLAGMLLPLVSLIAYLAGIFPIPIDLSPYALAGTGTVLAWGIFYYRLLDIMPVAREMIVSSMSDAILVVDEHMRLVDLNNAAQKLLRLSPQASIGRSATEVLAPWPDIVDACNIPADGPVEIAIEAAGETRTYDMRTSALRCRREKPEGCLIVLRDITDRVRAEQALKESNHRLATLRRVDAEISRKLDVTYVATMALDAAMRLTVPDAAFIGLAEDAGMRIIHKLGAFPDDLTGQLIPPQTGILARVIETGEAELVTSVAQDPDYFELSPGVQAQITVPLLSGSRLIGVINLESRHPQRFTPDIFETVKLLAARVATAIDNAYIYEERQKLVNELDAFAHTVAHDLKNPLHVITGYVEMLLEAPESWPLDQMIEAFDAIRRSTEKARAIIDALLLLASVRSVDRADPVPLDMGAIVGEVCDRLAKMIEEHQAEITRPDQWPVAMGYAPWIEEIWVNYLSNAIKYGGYPPHIELGSDRLTNGQVRFWVKDNGPGLSPESQAILFHPFTRLDKTRADGHGLGLSIVHRIAERLNGEVGVESAIGQGSLFFFTLPGPPGGFGPAAG